MVLPIEAEHRAKRRALRLCQDHLRKVMNVYRKAMQLINAFVDGDHNSMGGLYKEVLELSGEVDDSKRMVVQELVEIGAILLNREDFLRFTDLISEISDFCKGIAFRVLQLSIRGWSVPEDLKKEVSNLANAVFDTFAKLRDTFLMLNYGSPKVLEKAKDVEVGERKVDNMYRELEMGVLSSDMKIPTLLLIRDIIQLLEDTADKIEDAADAVRMLAFAI